MNNNFEAENARQYPLLDDTQLTELERRLSAAEQEIARQLCKPHIERTPIIADFEFKAAEYVRRLIEDVKHYRAAPDPVEAMRAKCEAKLREMADEAEKHSLYWRYRRGRKIRSAMAFDAAADAIAALSLPSAGEPPPNLEAENAKLKRAVDAALSGEEGDQAAVKIENARMRDALEIIANTYEDFSVGSQERRIGDLARAALSPTNEQSAKTEYNRLDIRAIAREQLQRMKEAGESHEMCARWISEAVNAAL